MLDSSPVTFPTIRRALKRSASTASLASLPTPPRTHRKHARGRSRGSCDSDSDDHVLITSDEEELAGGRRHKKRRMGETAAADADEEAFWLGGASDVASSSKKDATASTSTSKSQAAPLLYRKRQQQQVDVALASPPPSHRKVAAVATPKMTTPSPPVTPKTRSSTRRGGVFRDSPDNPFLATPVEDSDTPGLSASSANPSPGTPTYDKPFTTYVFRGTRRVYQNPHYNHAEGRPLSPPPASKLPIEHPDYSPAVFCPPKLLFADARRKKGPTTRSRARARSPSLSSGDEADPAAEIRPTKLNFGDPEKKKVTLGKTKTLDQELIGAGEPLPA